MSRSKAGRRADSEFRKPDSGFGKGRRPDAAVCGKTFFENDLHRAHGRAGQVGDLLVVIPMPVQIPSCPPPARRDRSAIRRGGPLLATGGRRAGMPTSEVFAS